MRIVTRPDFDGIVCAVILKETENIDRPTYWIEPSGIQNSLVEVKKGDIIANLPFDNRCSMWFDHHISNKTDQPFEGAFSIAPSAARVVYDYYNNRITRDYDELINETDKIDSALLTPNEVSQPENHPYLLLSMTISNRNNEDEKYWNRLVGLLGNNKIEKVLNDSFVKEKSLSVIERNKIYKKILMEHTYVNKHISITDLRSFNEVPSGNRFLAYSLFPNTYASVKIRYADNDPNKVILSIGHNIFNKNCNVNVGLLL